MMLRRLNRAKRQRDANVTEIEPFAQLMHYVVVIGKAQTAAVMAPDVYVAAAAQRSRGVRRGDIHRVKIAGFTLLNYHASAMMEVVIPAGVRGFRAVDKNIALGQLRAYGHHPDTGPFRRAVHNLDFSAEDIYPLDSLAGKRRPGGAHIESQPPAVRRPGVDISKLMMTWCEGELSGHGFALKR
ncbi:hypothetical protein HMPREF0201_04526 [Cedecea davisae DSM 4568]|uniref:Uncharacterized protein n=1 Tax=Cedecea davisae DSM 4568 TaxID=566551 RepID=S3IGD3_9ENTR|nr:hypothetical protein HMPREF0201_04526 [Cedecea davisae DSM 4568]